jgi:nitroreductase
MDAIEAIHGRRSIRAYRAEPVERPLIEDLLWAAAQAPTPPVSGNEAWSFAVIEGRERLAALGERARRHAREHQPPGRPWSWTERPGFEVFWGAPVLVIISARSGNPEAPFDCCRAGQNLLLAAHARGLGACWVGAPMPWLTAPGVAQELGLRDGYTPSVAVVLGLAAEQPAGNPRPRPQIHWLDGAQ